MAEQLFGFLGAVEVSRIRTIHPFFEIGVNDEGCIGMYSFPSLPETYDCHKPVLELDVKYPNVKELVIKSALYLSFPIIGTGSTIRICALCLNYLYCF